MWSDLSKIFHTHTKYFIHIVLTLHKKNNPFIVVDTSHKIVYTIVLTLHKKKTHKKQLIVPPPLPPRPEFMSKPAI